MLKYIAKFEAIIGFIGSSFITIAALIYNIYDVVPIYKMLILIAVVIAIIWGLIIYIAALKKRDVSPYVKVIGQYENKMIFVTNVKDFFLTGGYLVLYGKINEIYHLLGVVKIEHIQEKFVQGVVVCKLRADGWNDKRKIAVKPVMRPEEIMKLKEVDWE